MHKTVHSKTLNLIIALLLIGLLTLNYSKNFITQGNYGMGSFSFETYSQFSESLVIARMFLDKYNLTPCAYGLLWSSIEDKETKSVKNIYDKINNYDSTKETASLTGYPAQLGLQGYIFSFLYNTFHIPIRFLRYGCCALLAIILVMICYLINKKYSSLMGVIFYITFLLSPWMLMFAKNLYWVQFTWFLPVLFGLILSMNYSKKRILVPCIFISILIKCLCGYEYISTIMMATISFFIIDFLTTKEKEKRKEIFKTTIIVGIFCLLAFATALFIHAIPRGNGNIMEGLNKIYQQDVLRRTVISVDSEQFPTEYTDSLNAGIIETVLKYFNWSTHIILGLEGKYFKLMLIIVLSILIYNAIKKRNDAYRNIIMFVVFFLTTISWFVLAKAHSYIHTHMNFVIWYFGFIQICLYIIIDFILKQCRQGENENN